MPMSKIKDIKLETTATYQPLSDLNVRFWSQDKNTAELRFIITRNQFPLSLSKENVKVIIALESGSSFISSDDFIIDSEVEGVARYIIPTDFMRVASNVTGQVYVTTLDKEEIIVERQFKFTVSNDLLSNYPSEDKLRYIKTFDDLRNEIASRVSKLESDMETMEDYVTQVQDITQEGITSLTNLIKQKQDAYNANHTAKMKELNDKGSEYSAKFDDDKVYMDDKFQAFQESVNGSGLITTGQSKDWQKYKLTLDNGTPFALTGFDFNDIDSLETGNYFLNTSYNSPFKFTSYGFLKIEKASNNSKKAIATSGNSNQYYVKYKWNGEWSDWEELITAKDVTQIETLTGSQSKANVAENNAKVYADSKVDEQHNILFSGSVNGVGQTVNLTGNMNDYEYIIVSGDILGNDFSQIMVPSIIGSVVNIQGLNLRDSDGMLLGVNEVKLETTSTTIKITNDVAYDNPSNTGSGPNRNAFTITRVEGVHKK